MESVNSLPLRVVKVAVPVTVILALLTSWYWIPFLSIIDRGVEGEDSDSNVSQSDEVEFWEPNPNLPDPCPNKPGAPTNAKVGDIIEDIPPETGLPRMSRYITQTVPKTGGGQREAVVALGRIYARRFGGELFVEHYITVMGPYEGLGVATQLAEKLNQDWIDKYGTDYRMLFRDQNQYGWSCYWDKHKKGGTYQGHDWHWLGE